MFAGQVIVGFCVSFTVMVKLQESKVPSSLRPVAVTVVVPTGKKEPDAGLVLTVPQFPVKVGAGKLTFAPHCPGVFDTVILFGQAIMHAPPQHRRVAA